VLAFCAAFSFAATTVPVQLLNPTGSTAGQAIVSTGPTGAPAWGSVNASTLNGATFAAPGAIGSTTPGSGAFTTLQTSGAITPSQTSGIVGTTTNNNANAGSIGEYASASTSLTSITAGTVTNFASVALTAGDWDCSGAVDYVPAGTTTISQMIQGINTASATLAPFGSASYFEYAGPAGNEQVMQTPTVRVSLASAGTAYLTGFAQFAVSTAQARGLIRCRRVR
jgi:hypothetical protein